jgi:prepilin-type processing-associated H-X9-DG protein
VHHHREAPIDVDNKGVFFLNSRIRYEDVTDGSAQTIFLGEIQAEVGGLGWMSGTRATLRNTGLGGSIAGAFRPGAAMTADSAVSSVMEDLDAEDRKPTATDPLLVVGGFGSLHPGGSQFAFGDGRVGFMSGGASPLVMQLLAHRADGRLLDQESY